MAKKPARKDSKTAPGWPADAVERRPVDKLTPYARNARTHSEEQVAQIAASIREWGWTMPVLVDEADGIIAGHGRVMAARKLGVADVPVLVARGWTEAQKRAYVLADNKLTLNGGWDNELLRVELEELGGLGFDLELTGFGADEIAGLTLPNAGLTDPDEVPAVPVNPVSMAGDCWLLGRHRLLAGDSTVATDVERVMGGAEADFIFTSPPYSQQRNYGTEGGIGDWDALMQGVFSLLPAKAGAQVLVNLGLVHNEGEWRPYWNAWIEWMRSAGWCAFGWYVWDQGPGLPGDWNGRLAPSHEFVFHFNREAVKPRKTVASKHAGETLGGGGLRSADGEVKRKTGHGNKIQAFKIRDSVFRVMRHKGGLGKAGSHPAVFPVALVTEAADAYSKPGDHLFEPFSGGGTTLIASETAGRACHAIELNPAYVDVAVKRWQDFTGQDATLDGDGRTFQQVSDDRYDPGKNSRESYDAGIKALRERKASAA